jgi:nicotinamide-nucleotide amidase
MISQLKKFLLDNKMTISVAESCTAGNLQALLSSINGASDYFEGGITVYNIDQKVKHLEVDREVAEKVDCVSQEVADQMALGVAKLFDSRVSVSTTGYINKHLFYSIVIDNKIVYRSKMDLEQPIYFSRTEAQRHAPIHIIAKLMDILDEV